MFVGTVIFFIILIVSTLFLTGTKVRLFKLKHIHLPVARKPSICCISNVSLVCGERVTCYTNVAAKLYLYVNISQ